MYLTENLQEKWQPVLEHPDLPKIEDSYKRAVTTVILENQERAVREDAQFMTEAAPANFSGAMADTGGVAKWDPVLISLVRRAMPNLIAYDVCGVQPMTGPTGLIFAMRSRYGSQAGAEALFNEANTEFSGDNATTNNAGASGDAQAGTNPAILNDSPSAGTYTTSSGMTTAGAEALGDASTNAFAQMAFSIDKVTVTKTQISNDSRCIRMKLLVCLRL
jgi:hypothetical protein